MDIGNIDQVTDINGFRNHHHITFLNQDTNPLQINLEGNSVIINDEKQSGFGVTDQHPMQVFLRAQRSNAEQRCSRYVYSFHNHQITECKQYRRSQDFQKHRVWTLEAYIKPKSCGKTF